MDTNTLEEGHHYSNSNSLVNGQTDSLTRFPEAFSS